MSSIAAHTVTFISMLVDISSFNRSFLLNKEIIAMLWECKYCTFLLKWNGWFKMILLLHFYVNWKSFPFLFFSCALCAAVDGPVLRKKSPIGCYGNSLLGFLGGRGGVWESPCCEYVDQVCCFVNVCGHLSPCLFSSIKPFHAGMILLRCCVQYSGRTATLTCWSTFLVHFLSVSSSPSSSSCSAHCWVPLATTRTTGKKLTQHNLVTLAFD